MNLYQLETNNDKFYVISDSLDKAKEKVESELKKADYGFSKDQIVTEIKILTSELTEFPTGKLNFSSGNRLIIM